MAGTASIRLFPIALFALLGLSACQTPTARMAAVSGGCPHLVVVDGRTTFREAYEVSEQESERWGLKGWLSGYVYRIKIDRVLVGSLATREIDARIVAHTQLRDGRYRIVLEVDDDGTYQFIQTLVRGDDEDFKGICAQTT